MALNTLTSLKNAIGAGVRPNLFRVSSAGLTDGFTAAKTTGTTAATLGDFSILCKAAALPGSVIGLIDIPTIGGRRLKVAGDRTFAEWTTTVINDSDFKVREDLEEYQKKFVFTDFDDATTFGNRNTDRSTITVEQLGADGKTTIRKYELKNCFISDLSAIDVSYDTTDALEEFTVTWVYDFFTMSTT